MHRSAQGVLNDRSLSPLLHCFNTGKEETLIFHQGTSDGTAELIQAQNRRVCSIEEIAGVQRIVPEVFEQAAMKPVAAALGDDADLSAAAGAELRRIIAG